MPYAKQTWTDESPASSPVKYAITGDIEGAISASATITPVTSITPGSPLNAARLNHMEDGIETAQSIAEAAQAAALPLATILAAVYPVGCIYASTVATNPGTIFGFGTWAAYAQGRVMVGAGTSDAAYTAGATGGESNHTLSSAEMPSHTHVQNAHSHTYHEMTNPSGRAQNGTGDYFGKYDDPLNTSSTSSTTPTNQNTGGGGAHNNMPPYIVVYFWKRLS